MVARFLRECTKHPDNPCPLTVPACLGHSRLGTLTASGREGPAAGEGNQDMRIVKAAAVGLAGLGLVTAASTPAVAKAQPEYSPPAVEWVSPVVHANAASGAAVVHAKYRCYGGNEGTHLYIGVKQGPEVNATDHTSSQYARTFYSTNWNADGPGLSLNCDGVSHNTSFVVKPDPYWGGAAGAPALSTGQAFVQFCIFDSTAVGESDLSQGFAFDYSMRKVVLNRG